MSMLNSSEASVPCYVLPLLYQSGVESELMWGKTRLFCSIIVKCFCSCDSIVPTGHKLLPYHSFSYGLVGDSHCQWFGCELDQLAFTSKHIYLPSQETILLSLSKPCMLDDSLPAGT
ncbi:hypothetical protein ACJIZ3_013083 [Penstemon smallii]|uniref:Uncharacterized protein n=1 Tax=Penstemon smallii TaxID=265156 RepID=A0ABD3UQE3_9LAMI